MEKILQRKWYSWFCSGRFVLSLLMPLSVLSPPPGQTGAPGKKPRGDVFQSSDRCIACHNGLFTASGQDVSIGFNWRPTMMANSGRDPYWLASVRRETIDHPESRAAIEDECSACHFPMARFQAHVMGRAGEVFAHSGFNLEKTEDRLAADGVSCSLCHRITQDKFGTRKSFSGGFVVNTPDAAGKGEEYGPFKIDAGRARIMRSSSGGFGPVESGHIGQSEQCATCHTLYTKALGPGGKTIGELPEQMPYLEWAHSDFRGRQSCQSCHMPVAEGTVPVTSVFGEPRDGLSQHTFAGGNFFMQRVLNRYRAEIGTLALPQELDSAVGRTLEFLRTNAAEISIEDVLSEKNHLEFTARVQNLSGHKLPTAYPSRRVWLHVTLRNRNNRVLFESGAPAADGSIKGNDNDADAARYEPHYRTITDPNQVQVYEAIMADATGKPTTGLLGAARYLKDNRLLPRGFNKQTASVDVAVWGDAAQDDDFTDKGDNVRYSVDLRGERGPFRIEAELWYQPISYRWAQNLRGYDQTEPKRFFSFYESMAPLSGVILVRASATE